MSNFTRTLEDNKVQFPVNCPSFLGKSGSAFQPDRSEEKINHFHELDSYSNNEFACPRTPNIVTLYRSLPRKWHTPCHAHLVEVEVAL